MGRALPGIITVWLTGLEWTSRQYENRLATAGTGNNLVSRPSLAAQQLATSTGDGVRRRKSDTGSKQVPQAREETR